MNALFIIMKCEIIIFKWFLFLKKFNFFFQASYNYKGSDVLYSAPSRLNYTQPYCELVPFMTYPVINEQTVINLLKQQMYDVKYL